MRINPKRTGVLRTVGVSVLLLNFLLLSPDAAAREGAIDRCGEYQLKKEENLTVGFITDLDKHSINVMRIYGPEGKLVKTLADRQLTAQRCADITRDGIPELMLEAYTGGGRCCWTNAIYSMGAKIENRLVFMGRAVSIDFLGDEIIRNLDEEPALEIHASDASLLDFGGLGNLAVDSDPLPLILCSKNET